ncbi:MAG: Bro-N domain-containing protein, partial [Xenococcaceae cyanobacterium]
MTTVKEPGLYALIFRDHTPEAVKFQQWVFSEVLPSIRQTG